MRRRAPDPNLSSDVAGRSSQAIFERDRKDQIDRYFRALPILGTFGGLLALTGFFVASSFLPMAWARLVGAGFSDPGISANPRRHRHGLGPLLDCWSTQTTSWSVRSPAALEELDLRRRGSHGPNGSVAANERPVGVRGRTT